MAIAPNFTEEHYELLLGNQPLLDFLIGIGHITSTDTYQEMKAKLEMLTEIIRTGNSSQTLSISDITPLKGLTNLTRLRLHFHMITDISPLSNLTNLTELGMAHGLLTDISPISNLTNLTGLHMRSNEITDISPISNLTNLRTISVGNNISDISPLSNLPNLTGRVGLGLARGADLSPLSSMVNLTELWIEDSEVTNINALSTLVSLTQLRLRNNEIIDISPLANLTSMGPLYINNNKICDFSPIEHHTNLNNARTYQYSYRIADQDCDYSTTIVQSGTFNNLGAVTESSDRLYIIEFPDDEVLEGLQIRDLGPDDAFAHVFQIDKETLTSHYGYSGTADKVAGVMFQVVTPFVGGFERDEIAVNAYNPADPDASLITQFLVFGVNDS